MKIIGERVSILEKDEVFSLVVLPTTDKKKLGLLFLWLFAWSICGVIVFVNFFKLDNKDARLFIIIYLSFWAYFEYKILRTFIWKKWGKEKLWIKKGILHYQREVSGKGKINEYNLELVNNLSVIELNNSFADSFNQSFWVKGGERLEFQHQSKMIRFGLQLEEKEAQTILKELKRFIKN